MADIKLIIWDFDGVLADSEIIWLTIRLKYLNEKFNLGWSIKEISEVIGGTSDKTGRERLDAMGLKTDNAFWEKIWEEDYQAMSLLKAEPGVTDILNSQKIKYCVATGGDKTATRIKLETTGLIPYFTSGQIFTADMVEHGKPEPDLFLLAARKMGEKPENCVVIEDSLAGLTAGLRAGMKTVAYTGCEMNQSPDYLEKIKALGIREVFRHMSDFQKWLGLS